MKKTIYVLTDELNAFINSSNEELIGQSYEWEGENVVHLHTNKLSHSFGDISRVFFCKEIPRDVISTADCSYVVRVYLSDDEVVANVYLIDNGALIEQEVNYIPSKEQLYSRNKGILEINILEKKRVMIVGLGSFGSQIAIELAKAGVGEFSLFDFDRVELHNLSRHTATTKDLGRLKTDVLEESILGKNPYSVVHKHPININKHIDLLNDEVKKADLVICATDNNESRFKLSNVLVRQQRIGIFGRAVTRAEGGDVFRYRPSGPCYCCLIGNQWYDQSNEEITNVVSARNNGQIAQYTSESDADAMVQVGLSSDIEPICNMMVKLALVELSRGAESGISCLENELVYDYYMWANRRERRHVNWSPMPSAGAKPTIMRWYGARISKNENCSLCSSNNKVELDKGEDIISKYGDIIPKIDKSRLKIEE